MKTNHILIDFENVRVKSLELLNGEHFKVHLFLGPNHPKLPTDLALAMHERGDRSKYVRLDVPGPNALDFHIAYYLGTLSAVDPTAFFHIISKDTGFDPLIQHLKAKKILAARSESIETMPCFRTPSPISTGSQNNSTAALGDLVKLVLEDLKKRKAAKPRKLSTLRSTVQARIGKDAASNTDAVVAALVGERYVTLQDDKVTYHLPT